MERFYRSESPPWLILYCALVAAYIFSASGNSTMNLGPNWPEWLVAPVQVGIVIAYGLRARHLIGRSGANGSNERISLFAFSLPLLVGVHQVNFIALALILWSNLEIFGILTDSSTTRHSRSKAFISALILGLCMFISPWLGLWLPWIWYGLYQREQLDLKSFIWSILALVTPLYLIQGINFIISGEFITWSSILMPAQTAQSLSISELILYPILLGVSLYLIQFKVKSMRTMIVRRRKATRILLSSFIPGLTTAHLLWSFEGVGSSIILFGLGMGIIWQLLFQEIKPRLSAVLLLITLIALCIRLVY